MAVIELSAAKAYLNISGDTDNAELQTVIDGAVAAIEAIVGPIEVTANLTAKIKPTCHDGLILPILPVAELVSVTPYAGDLLDLAGLYLDAQAGLVTWAVGSSTPRFSALSYTVVYKAGRNPVPADLRLSVKEMVRHLWSTQRGRGQTRPNRQGEALANTLPGAAFALPIRVEQLLTPYTFPGFA